jgi:hypothetical protein
VAHKGPANPERAFGISVGTVLCVIGALLYWRGRTGRAEIIGGIGVVLVFFGYVQPKLLAPISRLWWKFAVLLGWFNARVLLSLFFFAVLTPLGLLWRLTGKDPLKRRRQNWQGWSPYPARFKDKRHFTKMF